MGQPLIRGVLSRASWSCCALMVAAQLGAQSTMTDADVVARGAASMRIEHMRVANRANLRGWSLYTSSNAVGVGHGLELSAGASWLPGDDVQPLAGTTGLKWRLLDQEHAGVSAAVGGTAFFSLARGSRRAAGSWGLVYGTLERSLGDHAPVLALGAYALVEHRDADDSRRGILMSVSQPISSHLDAGVEWISGNNWFGYLSPGVTVSRGACSLWLGYSRGTSPRGNSGPAASLSVDF